MQVTALHNQTLLDIAIRHCGTVEAVADIAILNNIGITVDLVPGQRIAVPAKDYGNQEVINYFRSNNLEPATGLNGKIDGLIPDLGIGIMAIGSTFIIR